MNTIDRAAEDFWNKFIPTSIKHRDITEAFIAGALWFERHEKYCNHMRKILNR